MNEINNPSILNESEQHASPSSNQEITEKTYPITLIWVFKAPGTLLLIDLVLLPFISSVPAYFFYILLAAIITLIANPLQRANFHYRLEDKYFWAKQGVIGKKEKHMPYGVIQNVIVKQGILDRILGIANVVIENASSGGGWLQKMAKNQSNNTEFIGFMENKLSIPGLKKADAEALKAALLVKVKENPIKDARSGL